MKIKKSYLIGGIIILLIIGLLFLRFVVGGDEDTWIRNAQGILVKHGNPSAIPD